MKVWFRIAALILPLIALSASWAFTHYKSQQGTTWIVPISGYDPRDLLRGHYVIYRYEWPGLSAPGERHYISAVCIKGVAPKIDIAVLADNIDPSDPVPKSDCTITARVEPGSESENGLSSGKIYIAQTKADALQRQLLDPKLQAFAHIRIRDDGIITPIELSFQPRATPLPK